MVFKKKEVVKTPVFDKPDVSKMDIGVDMAVEPSVTVVAEVKAPVQVKQFELSDADVLYLGAAQYSDDAWQHIGRKHGVDHTTREVLPNTYNRAFIAQVKKYTPLPSGLQPTIMTTKNMFSDAVPADSAAIRDAMRKRDLTKPTSDEKFEEEV